MHDGLKNGNTFSKMKILRKHDRVSTVWHTKKSRSGRQHTKHNTQWSLNLFVILWKNAVIPRSYPISQHTYTRVYFVHIYKYMYVET